MALDYAALAAMAQSLITGNGRTVTLRKLDQVVADPAKPWRGPSQASPSPTNLLNVPAAIVGYHERDVDNDIVRRGDKKALIASSDVKTGQDLAEYDQLVDGSDTWKIVGVRTIEPGDTKLIYILQLRR